MLAEMFNYDFMVRAGVAGIFIAISSALVGVPLVLKKNAMLSDGLSHAAFAAFVIAAVGGIFSLEVAIPLVILVSFFILRLSDNAKINGDLMIALISTSALALGVFLVAIFGINIDINSYLFGSILGTNQTEIFLAGIVAIFTVMIYIVYHNQIFALTFEGKFAKAIGIKTGFYRILLAILCSIVIVVGMKLVGALLISGLILFPTLTSKYLAKSFRGTIIFSVIFATLNFLIGFVLSYLLGTPTGATIVLTSLVDLIMVKLVTIAL